MQHQFSFPEKKLQEAFETVKTSMDFTPQNNWKESDKDSKLSLINYTREDPIYKIGVSRGDGVVNFGIKKIIEIITNPEHTQKYQKHQKLQQKLCETPMGHKINYTQIGTKIGSDRDLVTINGYFENNGSHYIISTSISGDVINQLKPEVKDITRAELHYRAIVLTPITLTSTKMVNISCMDLKGSIPGFVKSKMNNSRGINQIKSLIEYLQTL